jgi:hypothetical protein
VKACGVVVAMVQGHNWVPIPSNGSRVNVGTTPAIPAGCRSQRHLGRVGAGPTDLVGVGRRTRSSPRLGKPITWDGVRHDRSIKHMEGDTLVNTGVSWPDVTKAWARVLAMQTKQPPLGDG